jgi:hypothetical protein
LHQGINDINAYYKNNNQQMKQLVFDHELGIVPKENTLKSNGIELSLKTAGQKSVAGQGINQTNQGEGARD